MTWRCNTFSLSPFSHFSLFQTHTRTHIHTISFFFSLSFTHTCTYSHNLPLSHTYTISLSYTHTYTHSRPLFINLLLRWLLFIYVSLCEQVRVCLKEREIESVCVCVRECVWKRVCSRCGRTPLKWDKLLKRSTENWKMRKQRCGRRCKDDL